MCETACGGSTQLSCQQQCSPSVAAESSLTRPGSRARRMAGYLKRRIVPKSSSRPQRRKMVARAPARICTPHLAGKAVVADQPAFFMTMPAHSIPTTRGRRSCHAIPAPIWEATHRRRVAQAACPGKKAEPMEKNKTAGGEVGRKAGGRRQGGGQHDGDRRLWQGNAIARRRATGPEC